MLAFVLCRILWLISVDFVESKIVCLYVFLCVCVSVCGCVSMCVCVCVCVLKNLPQDTANTCAYRMLLLLQKGFAQPYNYWSSNLSTTFFD